MANGEARINGTPAWEGGAFVVHLTSTAAGSSVVDVRIDGREVGIHPRIWWD